MAFPAISAGAYGWDVEEVAKIAVGTVQGWLADQARGGRSGDATRVDVVRFVLFNRAALTAFRAQMG